MRVFNTYSELRSHLDQVQKKGQSLGFVPTMGALHEGHLSLVTKAKKETDCVLVSVFVNPTQFNNSEDLHKYPRTLAADLSLLEGSKACDIVFAPINKEEVYNELYQDLKVDLQGLDSIMEGEHRPGHFDGVVNVVNQLFKIVQADRAYFGEKDFQQLAIIRHFVKTLKLPIEIVACPIKREAHGLAMSSRNERLSAKQRRDAGAIYEALQNIKENYLSFSLNTCIEKAVKTLNAKHDLTVEYIQAIDGHSLDQISEWHDSDYVQVCCAVYCGEVRLIDNHLIFRST